MQAMFAIRCCAWLCLFGPVFLAGCGGSTAQVTGKVISQGKPVVWGTVTLVDRAGYYHQGNIDLNGNYALSGVGKGPLKIAVVSPDPVVTGISDSGRQSVEDVGDLDGGGTRDKFFEKRSRNTDNRPRPEAGGWFAVDPKYSDPEKSGLTGEVKSRWTTLDIDLK